MIKCLCSNRGLISMLSTSDHFSCLNIIQLPLLGMIVSKRKDLIGQPK